MGKKFIMLGGQRVYLKDADIKEEDDNGQVTTPPAAAPEGDDEELSEEVANTAKSIAKVLKKELGIDQMNDRIEKLTESTLSAPENSRLREILHGKDLVKDRGQLTADEKIVGFFHGLVTRDHTVLKALAEGVNADGGYLFPAEFLAELVKPLVAAPRMRALVRVVTMKRNVLNASSLLTRPKVYWTAENAAKTTTTATFGQPTLTARKAAAILYASDELIEDSTEIDVVRTIIDLFSEAVGIEEDRVILAGNGTTEPNGIFTNTGSVIPTIACSGNLDFDDIIELEYALPKQYRAGASYLVNPTNIKELRKLKDSNGRYLYEESRVTGQPATLNGYPVNEFNDVPESKIGFGNWKLAYWFGDRRSMYVKISQDTETAFTKDQTAIRVVERVGGSIVLGQAARIMTNIP